MAHPIRITHTEILSNDHYPLQKISFEIGKKDGTKKEQNLEVYKPANAVTALLYNQERKTVILIKQFRLVTFLDDNPTGIIIETCAGLIEKNENPDDTIKRELKEETGYNIKSPVKLFELYSSPGSFTEKLSYYLAPYTAADKVEAGGGLARENESIEIIELPFEEAYLKINSGEIKDAKTVLLLQYAKLNIW